MWWKSARQNCYITCPTGESVVFVFWQEPMMSLGTARLDHKMFLHVWHVDFFENNLANLWAYAGYVFPKCQHVLSIPTSKNDCPFFIAQSERRLTKNSSERMPLRPGNSMAILTAIPMLITGLGESTQPQTCSSTTHAGRTPNCGREENRLVKLFHLVPTSRFIHTHTQCTDMYSMYSIAILITFSQL